ncbi:MAG: leucine-rich repeat domain-containing protein [Bacteroidaceae bacterium]|nr:leucine-rich repeat domain-containing protein [Bacteroidaceae bacterium]
MKKFLLSLCLTMLSVVGAWAQEIDKADTSDEVGAAVRRLEVVLSGDWLNGDNVEDRTEMLIDLIMGYEDDAFNADKAFTEVTIKSAEGSTVTINNKLLQQLVTGKATVDQDQTTWHTANNKITRLDLSGVAVTGYVGNASETRTENSICPQNASPVVYFAMPSFEVRDDQTYTIPSYVLNGLTNMDELILPANTKKVGTAAFAGLMYNKFKLNVGLEFIGNSAFHASSDRKGMETLDIPSSVKYIGPDAFWFRSFTDIYFHSAQAPICPVGYGVIEKADHAMLYNDCYMGNNGFTDSNEHAESQTSGVYPMGRDGGKPGKANRENYMSEGKRWMVMVHFPSSAEMAAEGKTLDIASYKDVTRVYNKVYGNIYGSGNDAEKIEIAIPGHEQEYIQREKVWDEANSFDYVGKETTPLTYGTVTAAKDVNSGYEDTYRGLNYIWPSQSQWVRAFNTVALGYNWDGVTEYRPTLTSEQIALMVEDGLQVNMKQDGSGSGQWVAVGEDITYDEAKANEYNAGLEGAVHAGEAKDWYTAEEAIDHNAELEGAVSAGDTHTYSEAEAYANNANLPDAISTSDIKEPAVPSQPAVYYTDDEKVQVNNVWYVKETLIYHDAVPAVYYEDSEVTTINNNEWYKVEDIVSLDGYYTDAYLQSMGVPGYNYLYSGDTKTDENGTTLYKFTGKIAIPGATVVGYQWQVDQGQRFVKEAGSDAYWEVTADSKQVPSDNIKIPAVIGHDDIYYTETEVNQYNMDLDGAVKPGDEVTFTAETAAAYNAALTGAVKAGDEKEWWSAEEAIAENKKLPGAREAGFTSKSYDDPAIADLLSWVAFQSTRRCVFGANDGGGDDYDPKVPSSEAWWTICLPFDLTKAQIDKYFGEGTHVCLFTKVDRNINPGEGKNPYIKFHFTSDQYVGKTDDQVVLQAHVPYMIYPTIKGADGTAAAVGRIPASEYYKKTGNPIPTEITATDGKVTYRFIGNYDTMLPVQNADGSVSTTPVVIPQYSYFYAKKKTDTKYKFWFVQNTNMKWAANKCVIQSTSADRGFVDQDTFFSEAAKQTNGAEAKQITILGDEIDGSEEEATAIDVIIIAGDGENSEVIYNLNGQVLNVAPQHGIYIKNGKKYIAK